MAKVFVGLGSNLNDPGQQLDQALQHIQADQDLQLLQTSAYYISSPLGGKSQPDYVNAVVMLETDLAPLDLLKRTQGIEVAMGRDPNHAYHASRVIDLDILLYDQWVVSGDDLNIPHPGLLLRHFVLYPLLEIAPDWILPSQATVAQAWQQSGLSQPSRLMDD